MRRVVRLELPHVGSARHAPPLYVVRGEKFLMLGGELAKELPLASSSRRAPFLEGLEFLQPPLEELVVPAGLHHELLEHVVARPCRVQVPRQLQALRAALAKAVHCSPKGARRRPRVTVQKSGGLDARHGRGDLCGGEASKRRGEIPVLQAQSRVVLFRGHQVFAVTKSLLTQDRGQGRRGGCCPLLPQGGPHLGILAGLHVHVRLCRLE